MTPCTWWSIRFATSCCVRTPSRSCIWVYHRTAFPGGGGGRHIEGAGAHPCDAHEDPIRETAGRRQAMDMNYDILSYPRPSPSRGQHPCLQRDPRPSGRRTRREAGTVHAQTPHEPQQCGAHAPRQGAGRDLILRPKTGPPSRGGGPAVFPTYVIRPMSVFLGVPRTKRQPLVDGRDGRSRDPSSTSPDQALRGDVNLIANRAPCR